LLGLLLRLEVGLVASENCAQCTSWLDHLGSSCAWCLQMHMQLRLTPHASSCAADYVPGARKSLVAVIWFLLGAVGPHLDFRAWT
jgi:hypothetical protein